MTADHVTVGSVDPELWTRLYAALDNGAGESVLEYLASVGDPNLRPKAKGWTLLHAAAFKDRRVVVESLIAHGADVDAVRDGDAFTPLATAAHKGHLGCLRVLLAAGASVECRPLGMPLLESLQHAQSQSEEVRSTILSASMPANRRTKS